VVAELFDKAAARIGMETKGCPKSELSTSRP
jgi:hypothetical protein